MARHQLSAALVAIHDLHVAKDDSYGPYVKTAKDFRSVHQDQAWPLAPYPSWTYMPWTFQWPIGYNDASGKTLGAGRTFKFDWKTNEALVVSFEREHP